jgi:hypothetical protein
MSRQWFPCAAFQRSGPIQSIDRDAPVGFGAGESMTSQPYWR